MSAVDAIEVRPAIWPRDLDAAAALLQAYFRLLTEHPDVPPAIRSLDRAPELKSLQDRYGSGGDVLLLARRQGNAVGCAAVQRLLAPKGAVEMKRLYVSPEARGSGAGRQLVLACASVARSWGADALLLDTLPAVMPGAVRLYRALGFEPTTRYNRNLGPEFAFFRLNLTR